jgi:transcriptional regulator with GAF, ATPase, and Fis domain
MSPPALTPEAMVPLEACIFPGNVRELKNVIE